MRFLEWIIEELEDAADWFHELYLETRDWPDWAGFVSNFFYGLYGAFMWLAYDFEDFNEWVEGIEEDVKELGIWGAIKALIKGWLPGLEGAITVIENLAGEVLVFFDNPTAYLREKFTYVILPWAIVNIPFLGTLYKWYTDFKDELELFFDNPGNYLKDKFENVILPWGITRIPFISWLYTFYQNFKGEIVVFFDDPVMWLRGKFENDILPWAKENIPFISTLVVLVDTITDDIMEFFRDPVTWLEENTILGTIKEFWDDPLQWAYNKLDEWFERFW